MVVGSHHVLVIWNAELRMSVVQLIVRVRLYTLMLWLMLGLVL